VDNASLSPLGETEKSRYPAMPSNREEIVTTKSENEGRSVVRSFQQLRMTS